MSTMENVLTIAVFSAILIALIALVIAIVRHKLRNWDERMLIRQKQQAHLRYVETMTRKKGSLDQDTDRGLARRGDSIY